MTTHLRSHPLGSRASGLASIFAMGCMLLALAGSAAAQAPCTPSWIPTFGPAPGVSGEVGCMIDFDGGSAFGRAVVVGGGFNFAGGIPASHIARWNGSQWSVMGSLNGVVRAMAVYDDGGGPKLYIGGSFTSSSGVPVSRVARWTGSGWADVGGGVTGGAGVVRAMAVYDDGSGGGPSLCVGGAFTSAGGVPVSNIARWNGSSWSPLGSGVADGGIHAMAVHDDGLGGGPRLCVGGSFTSAGGGFAYRVARWNGTSWSSMQLGMVELSSIVRALCVFDDGSGAPPSLVAGGAFTTAGGTSAMNIARWNGTTWSALGSGTGGEVFALAAFDDGEGGAPSLAVGGVFTTAGGVSAKRIARWQSGAWSELGEGVDAQVNALGTFTIGGASQPELYLGGLVGFSGSTLLSRAGRWVAGEWRPLGSGLLFAGYALAAGTDPLSDAPRLYAGGDFTIAGPPTIQRIAAWDGAEWSALGGGVTGGPVRALVMQEGGALAPRLIAGGEFTAADGLPVGRIAAWDGIAWAPLGAGLSGPVRALAIHDDGLGDGPALFAGGTFATAGGVVVNNVARWDGRSWSALGSGLDGTVRALCVYDDGLSGGPMLCAGGEFTAADGVGVSRIARWNGSVWLPFGSGMNGAVRSLVASAPGKGTPQPTLYAGGAFTTAGGVSANRVARWNGVTWSPLGTGMNGPVDALALFDDGVGSGLRLHAAGSFTSASGGAANYIARWSEPWWAPLGPGVSAPVHALATFDIGGGAPVSLAALGSFTTSTTGDSYIARWAGCLVSSSGPADLDGNGIVDGADAALLLAAFGPCEGCSEDLDGDGMVDGADLGTLLSAWGS
ncbi:MAG TPA: hypothetical protein PKC43_14975 [Phycisphaerales bacterium]|nr:hypothetical protein [Phycisphaerales bacterium]HMP38736.1 hypothetical protein [Phycisphaerales bacterium]